MDSEDRSTQKDTSSSAGASSPGLTPALAVHVLDGCEYGDECSREFEVMLKANGLVAGEWLCYECYTDVGAEPEWEAAPKVASVPEPSS